MSEQNIYDAKRALKSHIKFMESMLGHLDCKDDHLKYGALYAAYCIDSYMNNQLIAEIEKKAKEIADGSKD